jgi:transcriptional regulator with XRE-family HTH domain
MAKDTMGKRLPRQLEEKLRIVGEQIRLARLRRNLTQKQIADRAMISVITLTRVEKGMPNVAIGIYLRVLYALQLADDILCIAQNDPIGRDLQDMNLKHRERASKKV